MEQSIWGGQSPALRNLYKQAGNLFGWSSGAMQGAAPGMSQGNQGISDQAQQAWNNQLQGGAYSNVNANDIISGINRSIEQPSETGQMYRDIMGGQGNVYLGGMKDVMAQDAADAQAQSMRGLDQRAAGAGMGGSSNYRNLQRDIVEDSNKALQNRTTQLGYDTFDQDLSNKMRIADSADSNTLARQQMLTNMLGQKQNAMTGGIGMGSNMQGLNMGSMSPYMLPWQAMGQYSNALGAPVRLTSGSMMGDSSGKSMSGGGGVGGGKN